MAPHSSTLAWKIPWMEEPGRLQSLESLRVGHDWVTSLSLSCIGEGNGNPLQCSCLENPRDRGAWWAAIYGVAQSRTRRKRLSSSSSSRGPGTCHHGYRGMIILITHICYSESESRSVVSYSLCPHGLYSPWNSPGQNTGVGSLSLFQVFFPTQGSNIN